MFCLTGLLFSLVVLQRPWIEPVERKVRLKPSRPILPYADVEPGSAYDLLQQACDFTPPAGDLSYNCMRQLSANKWSDTTFSNLVDVLEASRTNLILVRKAVEAPHPQIPTLTNFNHRLPLVQGTRDLARLLTISACRKSFHEDYEEAYKDLLTGIRAGKILTRGGALIHHLIAFANADIGCYWMTLLSDRHLIPAPVLTCSARALMEVDKRTEPFVEAFRHEWLFAEQAFDDMMEPANGMYASFGHAELPVRIAVMLGPLLGSDSETTRRNLRLYYKHLCQHVSEPVNLSALKGLMREYRSTDSWEIFLYRDPVGLILAQTLGGAWDRAAEKYLEHRKQLRTTAAYLAAQAYCQEKGSMPESLDQLVPDYLDSVPVDPYTRKPMQYTNVMATVSATLSSK